MLASLLVSSPFIYQISTEHLLCTENWAKHWVTIVKKANTFCAIKSIKFSSKDKH